MEKLGKIVKFEIVIESKEGADKLKIENTGIRAMLETQLRVMIMYL